SPVPTSLLESPWPGNSSANVRRPSQNTGWLNIQLLTSAPNPCRNNNGTPPLPISQQRTVRPSTRSSLGAIGAASTVVSPEGWTTANCDTNASISASGVSGGATTASKAPIGKVVPSGATMRVSVPAASASITF